MNQPDVIKAKIIRQLEFAVTFADGLTGAVKILPSHLYGVFEKLKAPDFFSQLSVTEGFVAWPDERSGTRHHVSSHQAKWRVGVGMMELTLSRTKQEIAGYLKELGYAA